MLHRTSGRDGFKPIRGKKPHVREVVQPTAVFNMATGRLVTVGGTQYNRLVVEGAVVDFEEKTLRPAK